MTLPTTHAALHENTYVTYRDPETKKNKLHTKKKMEGWLDGWKMIRFLFNEEGFHLEAANC